jgi:hypothetical protein
MTAPSACLAPIKRAAGALGDFRDHAEPSLRFECAIARDGLVSPAAHACEDQAVQVGHLPETLWKGRRPGCHHEI